MRSFLLFATVTLVCASNLVADPTPDLAQSRVTLTYPEFRTLLDGVNAANKPKVNTPPTALLSAEYEVDLADPRQVVRARWRIESFDSERRLTPVCPARLQLLSNADAKTTWVRDGESLAVITTTAGIHDIQAAFVSPSDQPQQVGGTIQFPIRSAPANLLKLRNVPKETRIRVKGGSPLPSPEGELHFALSTSEVEIHLEAIRPEQSSRWEWRCESVVSPTDTGLQFQTRLMAALLAGDGRELRVELPNDLRALRVEAADLTTWRIETTDTSTTLVARWEDGSLMERILTLNYQVPLAFDATEWPLSAPAPTEPGAQNIFALRKPASLEISGALIESPRTSDWLRGQIQNQPTAFVQTRAAIASVTARALPLAETANLTVKAAEYHTRVVADGSLITTARIELENEGAAQWEFSLPPGGQLLSCSMNGRSLRPVQRSQSLEIPLNPADSKGGLTFSFTGKLPSLSPVAGAITIPLPTSPTFIHALTWTLEIPDAYEVAGIESQAGVVSSGDKRELRLRQELIRGTQVAAEVHYRKRGLQP